MKIEKNKKQIVSQESNIKKNSFKLWYQSQM